MRETLVVAEVEIGFCAIVGNVDFAVLKWRHRARVDVQVGIKLHQVDGQPATFQKAADGGRRQSFTQRRHNSACYKDVLCRHLILTLNCLLKFVQAGRTNNYAKTRRGCIAFL